MHKRRKLNPPEHAVSAPKPAVKKAALPPPPRVLKPKDPNAYLGTAKKRARPHDADDEVQPAKKQKQVNAAPPPPPPSTSTAEDNKLPVTKKRDSPHDADEDEGLPVKKLKPTPPTSPTGGFLTS